MAHDFFIPTEIVPCPTVREQSGLAMSSRNALLSPEAREKAALLFRALHHCGRLRRSRRHARSRGLSQWTTSRSTGDGVSPRRSLDGVRLIDNVPLPED